MKSAPPIIVNIAPRIPIPNIFSPGPVGGSGFCGSSTMGVGCVSKIGVGLNIALPVVNCVLPTWDRGGDWGKLTARGVGVGVEVAGARAVVGVEVGDMLDPIVTLAGVVVDKTFSLV